MHTLKICIAALALILIVPLSLAVETIIYNGSQYTCQWGCIVEGGSVRDTKGGWVIEIREDQEGPITE